MAFYAGRLVLEPAMENPTLVVLTDRNDLDEQLFGTFSRCHELLRQKPVQAANRDHLRDLLLYPSERMRLQDDCCTPHKSRTHATPIGTKASTRAQFHWPSGIGRAPP